MATSGPITYLVMERSVPLGWTDEVPFVARDVEEHGDTAIGLGARCGEKSHARGCHPGVRDVEVLDIQEETHPACGLLADDGALVVSVGPRQQQSGRGTGRPDDDPPL